MSRTDGSTPTSTVHRGGGWIFARSSLPGTSSTTSGRHGRAEARHIPALLVTFPGKANLLLAWPCVGVIPQPIRPWPRTPGSSPTPVRGPSRWGGPSKKDSWVCACVRSAVVPAVDGVKYVSEIYSETNDVASVLGYDGANLTSWACDLDWTQPDPFADDSYSRIFDAASGYCAVDRELILAKGAGPNDALQNITSSLLEDNRYANIDIGCTYVSAEFYCALLFTYVDTVRPDAYSISGALPGLTLRR